MSIHFSRATRVRALWNRFCINSTVTDIFIIWNVSLKVFHWRRLELKRGPMPQIYPHCLSVSFTFLICTAYHSRNQLLCQQRHSAIWACAILGSSVKLVLYSRQVATKFTWLKAENCCVFFEQYNTIRTVTLALTRSLRVPVLCL